MSIWLLMLSASQLNEQCRAADRQRPSAALRGAQVTTLSTRATVLGVTNPRGHRGPLSERTALSGPLLSRFDLLLVMRDARNPDWDAAVASHILAGPEASAAAQERPAHSQVRG